MQSVGPSEVLWPGDAGGRRGHPRQTERQSRRHHPCILAVAGGDACRNVRSDRRVL